MNLEKKSQILVRNKAPTEQKKKTSQGMVHD